METQTFSIAEHLHLSAEEITFLEHTKLLSRKKIEQYLEREANLLIQHTAGEEVCHEQV